ncbi:MAG: bi-domain-containing oxidoreductase [Candidatus Kapaibacteriales bacterium]
MKQILQYQKNGSIEIVEVPPPVCPNEGILVKTAWSLISAGTEKTSVDNSKGSLIDRAKKQPDQVKLVLDTVKKQGISETFRRVQAKLDSYKQLGYSASGIVVESKCREFSVGDKVAVGGAGLANHAEYLGIPKNLAVKVPAGVSLEDASYAIVGAIGMQGFRQASPSLGDTIAVVGLGLIGQLVVMYLRAAGCRVIGLDIDESLFDAAQNSGANLCLKSSYSAIESINSYTGGTGCDSVIITAGTSSSEPLNLAMEITRKRGTVVITGAVGMDLKRHPFYKKEINLTISSSYGPGRYDPRYEEDGIDYPIQYVRWTENRNMGLVLDLISSGKVDLSHITTHRFELDKAGDAYEVVTGAKKEKHLGILLKYPEAEYEIAKVVENPLSKTASKSGIGYGIIGAGQFAQNYILPPLSKIKGLRAVTLTTTTPANAKSLSQHFSFEKSATDDDSVINDKDIDIVFCATRHDSHADIIVKSLNAKKHIFCEKPLCITRDQLDAIKEAYTGESLLMVGFNRRFSKPFKDIKNKLASINTPINMIYRVNAGKIQGEHWTQQENQGGRIIGEGCHFIDTMSFLCGSLPKKVFSSSLPQYSTDQPSDNNVSINIEFNDGSVGTLIYTSHGSKTLSKEYCEVHGAGFSAIMNNFESNEYYTGSKKESKSYNGEKGIISEINQFVDAVKNGKNSPIDPKTIFAVSEASIAAVESIKTSMPVTISQYL